MKYLLTTLLIFSLSVEAFALLSLKKNEAEVEMLLRNVSEASNEQNLDKLASTISREFQLIWVADDGTVLKTERVKREDYLKHIEAFWAGAEQYTYKNTLISSVQTNDGYTIGMITKQSYTFNGKPSVEENYQKVTVVKSNGTLKVSVIEMHPNPNRL
jgi:hypothetical protein